MPVPEGIISTSAVWTQPTEELDAAIVEADAEEATQEYVEETEEEEQE